MRKVLLAAVLALTACTTSAPIATNTTALPSAQAQAIWRAADEAAGRRQQEAQTTERSRTAASKEKREALSFLWGACIGTEARRLAVLSPEPATVIAGVAMSRCDQLATAVYAEVVLLGLTLEQARRELEQPAMQRAIAEVVTTRTTRPPPVAALPMTTAPATPAQAPKVDSARAAIKSRADATLKTYGACVRGWTDVLAITTSSPPGDVVMQAQANCRAEEQEFFMAAGENAGHALMPGDKTAIREDLQKGLIARVLRARASAPKTAPPVPRPGLSI